MTTITQTYQFFLKARIKLSTQQPREDCDGRGHSRSCYSESERDNGLAKLPDFLPRLAALGLCDFLHFVNLSLDADHGRLDKREFCGNIPEQGDIGR